jgi:multicomponent Na+:H+ antiporter subunit B
MFGLGGALLFVIFLSGVRGLPAFGHYRGPYGDILNRQAVAQRHATDVVTAVNLDYRGFDTLGEEFILFTCAAGVMLLLRPESREREEAPPEEEAAGDVVPVTSDAVDLTGLALVVPVLVLGLLVVSHGTITPGGGFQGGIVLGTALLLIYLAGHYRTLRRLWPEWLLEALEGLGAGGFVAVGFAGLIGGGIFLKNVLPLGTPGTLLSAGTMPIIYLSVGVEVGAALALIVIEFLRETIELHPAPTQ